MMNLKTFTAVLQLISTTFLVKDVSAANILGISPYYITSHFNVMQPIFLEIANRGHNVTVISACTDKNLPPNYRHIQVDKLKPNSVLPASDTNLFHMSKPRPILATLFFTFSMFTKYSNRIMESEQLQDFILNDESQFDLVIGEEFRYSPFNMLAYKYKAPLITMTTFGGASWVEDYMANPLSLHYVPHFLLPYAGPMTLVQRLKNVAYTFIDLIGKKVYFEPMQDKQVQKHFGHLPKPLPRVEDLERNISLVFLNTHFAIDVVRPQLPNIVEIGGVHIKSPKKLPQDLQKVMDKAKNGVIYFSMGSNLLGKDLPEKIRDAFLKVFSELKQTVLWKWEDDTLSNLPKNVLVSKWFPQTDLLAHPNMRLFITHGGLLSMQEAIYRGVPIIGIPIFGDQPSNIARAKYSGYAENLSFATLSEETIRNTLNKVLNDPSYHNKVKEISARLKDKPMTALETAIFWVEYVIRHNGAHHMKPISVHMPWYQYYLIDVIFILFALALLTLYIEYKLLIFIYKFIFKRGQKEVKISKNKKQN